MMDYLKPHVKRVKDYLAKMKQLELDMAKSEHNVTLASDATDNKTKNQNNVLIKSIKTVKNSFKAPILKQRSSIVCSNKFDVLEVETSETYI